MELEAIASWEGLGEGGSLISVLGGKEGLLSDPTAST